MNKIYHCLKAVNQTKNSLKIVKKTGVNTLLKKDQCEDFLKGINFTIV